jgi:hypothetical protein
VPGWGDGSTGNYVLNILVQPHTGVPHVLSVTRDDGNQPGGSPARFVVHFDEPVNGQQLAYEAYQNYQSGGLNQMPAFFIECPGGPFYPRLESYNDATNTATFVMLDGLPSGTYELHLSGANGLQDLAGNPLVGNGGNNGDYVYSFTFNDPARSAGSDLQHRYNLDPNNDPQNLGVLFPNELLAPVTSNGNSFTGVVISRDSTLQPPGTSVADAGDVYEIQVLQAQTYVFNLIDYSAAPVQGNISLFLSTDPAGNAVLPAMAEYLLDPGVYYVHVVGWQPADAGKVKYDVNIAMIGNPERPTPLTIGPAPAARLRVVATLPPPPLSSVPSNGQTNQGTPSSGSIPGGVLVALGSGPLGPGGTIAEVRKVLPGLEVLDGVVAQAPRFLRTEEFVQLVSLLQTLEHTGGDQGTAESTEKDSVNHTGTTLSIPFLPWNEAVDLLFRWWTRVEQQVNDVTDPVTADDGETEEFDLQAEETAVSAADPCLLALAAGGLFLVGVPGRLPRNRKDNPLTRKRDKYYRPGLTEPNSP